MNFISGSNCQSINKSRSKQLGGYPRLPGAQETRSGQRGNRARGIIACPLGLNRPSLISAKLPQFLHPW